jgi:hypothetical protein
MASSAHQVGVKFSQQPPSSQHPRAYWTISVWGLGERAGREAQANSSPLEPMNRRSAAFHKGANEASNLQIRAGRLPVKIALYNKLPLFLCLHAPTLIDCVDILIQQPVISMGTSRHVVVPWFQTARRCQWPDWMIFGRARDRAPVFGSPDTGLPKRQGQAT